MTSARLALLVSGSVLCANCRNHILLIAKLVLEVLQTIFVETTFASGKTNPFIVVKHAG